MALTNAEKADIVKSEATRRRIVHKYLTQAQINQMATDEAAAAEAATAAAAKQVEKNDYLATLTPLSNTALITEQNTVDP